MISRVATEDRYGEVRLAKHATSKSGYVVQSDDPRLGGVVGWTRTYVLATAPTASLGGVGEFAFSKDRKGFWVKESSGWILLGYLLSDVTQSQAKVVTPSGSTGTIEVAT
jgi:hypothetical protein